MSEILTSKQNPNPWGIRDVGVQGTLNLHLNVKFLHMENVPKKELGGNAFKVEFFIIKELDWHYFEDDREMYFK